MTTLRHISGLSILRDKHNQVRTAVITKLKDGGAILEIGFMDDTKPVSFRFPDPTTCRRYVQGKRGHKERFPNLAWMRSVQAVS